MRPFSSGRITRGLRFRLTASYALFFTLLLVGVGFLFRETLEANLERQTRDILDQEWAAVRGYLRIENGKPIWYYDPIDPDETFIVTRLQRIYLLADAEGNPIESSGTYRSIGIESPERIREFVRARKPGTRNRTGPDGSAYLIREGVIFDEKHTNPYFVAIGRPLADNQRVLEEFTFTYVILIPFLILGGCVMGWVLAGRALTPVLNVAQTAQRISGSNLSLRIASRNAGDELDYLIETFNGMIERLESSFQQIRQFSTDVSHELRTPLTALRGQLEVALFTAQSTQQYREAIIDSLQDIERLSQIVRALLQLSQAESGQLELQKVPVDLAAMVRDVAEQYQVLADEAGVRLSFETEAAATEADRVQLERLISNLLSNALKFTPAGGMIVLRTSAAGEWAELVVDDTGRGIPPEHLPHIFDRFYRVPEGEAPAPERGLGLGLSFVAWIVKAHGGSVHVESEPGKGTRFTVRLPHVGPGAPEGTAHGQPHVMKEV
jgi:heavy metal sensor kinase